MACDEVIAGDGLVVSDSSLKMTPGGIVRCVTHSVDYNRVTDEVLVRLRKRLPVELRGIVEDGDGTLDPVDLAMLADWLEERQYGLSAGRVRQMIAKPGTVYILEHPGVLSPTARQIIEESWKARLPGTSVIILEEGLELVNIIKPRDDPQAGQEQPADEDGDDAMED